MKKTIIALALATFSLSALADTQPAQQAGSSTPISANALVLQTDFSLKDGAVSAMQGVAFRVDRDLKMFDLTHEIPPYNIWEAAYRLYQTATYWPQGTVFVSVIDPGVGTERKSVVLKTKTGHYFVTPDNGTLTLVAEHFGIESLRQIDEQANNIPGFEKAHTFHHRDIYAYVGALLASGKVSFEQIGPEVDAKVVEIAYQKPTVVDGIVKGNIPVLDIQYGNIWTNIDEKLLAQANIKKGGRVCAEIDERTAEGVKVRYSAVIPYKNSFGDVEEGKPLMYLNSLSNASFALNMDSFADKFKIKSGAEWSVSLKSCEKKAAE